MGDAMQRISIIVAALIAASSLSLTFAPNSARAGDVKIPPPPPSMHAHVPAWWWAGFACPASIVLSALVADFRDNRQLTAPEAATCGLLFWVAMPVQAKTAGHH
jgi:hypothetical protein